MIVLDRIGTEERRVAWLEVPTGLPGSNDVRRVQARLRELGVTSVGELEERQTGTLRHAWSMRPESLVYESSMPLESLSPSAYAFYLTTILATLTWAPLDDLLSLHLAIYELVVNVHDHGEPLPGGTRRVDLVVEVGADSVRGILSDACREHDPTRSSQILIDDLVARRARRGFGTTMIRRALDELTHEFGPSGNVIRFLKRLQS